ncbi:hypothetical protein K445DRAFT_372735 [Daldinia sp. EC12]|nr:hypothetical protein K445DRAFT_372735 [Daldinia sp. EC12]
MGIRDKLFEKVSKVREEEEKNQYQVIVKFNTSNVKARKLLLIATKVPGHKPRKPNSLRHKANPSRTISSIHLQLPKTTRIPIAASPVSFGIADAVNRDAISLFSRLIYFRDVGKIKSAIQITDVTGRPTGVHFNGILLSPELDMLFHLPFTPTLTIILLLLIPSS